MYVIKLLDLDPEKLSENVVLICLNFKIRFTTVEMFVCRVFWETAMTLFTVTALLITPVFLAFYFDEYER